MKQNEIIQSKSRHIKRAIGLLVLLFCFFSVITALSAYYLYNFATSPHDNQKKAVIVMVSPGQGLNATTNLLWKHHLISSPAKFKIMAAVTGKEKKIKAGEYRITSSMSPWDILTRLVAGQVYLHKVTIPEGYNMVQIAQVLDEAKLCPKDEFLRAATDSAQIKRLGMDDSVLSVEGYLFPDTYYFPITVKKETILKTMVDRLRSVYKSEWHKRSQSMGFSQHHVLTLASIIEKETGDASERPLISSVFHNRLKKNMRLETDPTVIYGIKDFDGNLTRKHLRTKTPYNTYRRKGLPPGPIASPGLKAIEAALFPADSPYLYFVSKKDKTHKFSTNIRDHINSVRKYQLNR